MASNPCYLLKSFLLYPFQGIFKFFSNFYRHNYDLSIYRIFFKDLIFAHFLSFGPTFLQQPQRGRPRDRRSIGDLLEKTKYSLVANTSNYHISELVSSGNKLAVRFFAKQGRLPGRGFRAKFKIGKIF